MSSSALEPNTGTVYRVIYVSFTFALILVPLTVLWEIPTLSRTYPYRTDCLWYRYQEPPKGLTGNRLPDRRDMVREGQISHQ